ncbi:MAG: hypothetical protein Q9210_004093 [Variospora velana]
MKGLGQIKTVTKAIKYWVRYLETYLHRVSCARAAFIDTIEKLRTGIIEYEGELDALKKDPTVIAKLKPEYPIRVERRLDHSYENFMKGMARLSGTMGEIRKRLNIGDEAQRVLWDSYSRAKRERETFKLVLNEEEIEELLDEADRANKALWDCTDRGIQLEYDRTILFDFKETKAGYDKSTWSLQYVLEAFGIRTSGQAMMWSDILTVAVTLGSSVVQLDGTYWFKKQWSGKDVFFPKLGKFLPIDKHLVN